jgi:hypothetical protein
VRVKSRGLEKKSRVKSRGLNVDYVEGNMSRVKCRIFIHVEGEKITKKYYIKAR